MENMMKIYQQQTDVKIVDQKCNQKKTLSKYGLDNSKLALINQHVQLPKLPLQLLSIKYKFEHVTQPVLSFAFFSH